MAHRSLVIACVVALVGCSSTREMVRKDRRVARVRVTSAPPSATLFIDKRRIGRTPTAVEIPYVETEWKIRPAERRSGLALLVTSIVGGVVGAGLTAVGAVAASKSDRGTMENVLGPVGISFGVLGLLYGIPGAIGGGYLMSSAKSSISRVDVQPGSLRLGLELRGQGLAEARLRAEKAGYSRLRRLHYAAPSGASGSSGAWSAPGATVEIESLGFRPQRAVTPATKPTKPPARPRAIVAVFDIEDRGSNLKRELLKRMSDYMAMKIAAGGAFQVVPRDKLRERLRAQKKRSYKRCYAQSCQIEIGKELAAQKSLSTMIVRLGDKCAITSVLYDLRKSASEGGASASGGCSEQGIVATLEKIVSKLDR